MHIFIVKYVHNLYNSFYYFIDNTEEETEVVFSVIELRFQSAGPITYVCI